MGKGGEGSELVLLVILALIIPPAAVACVTGFDRNFALNLVLLVFFFFTLASTFHALFIVIYYTNRGERRFDTARQRREVRRQTILYGNQPRETMPGATIPDRGTPVIGSRRQVGASGLHAHNDTDVGAGRMDRQTSGHDHAVPNDETGVAGGTYSSAPTARDHGDKKIYS